MQITKIYHTAGLLLGFLGGAFQVSASTDQQIANAGLETARVVLKGVGRSTFLAGGIAISKTGTDTPVSQHYFTVCTAFFGNLLVDDPSSPLLAAPSGEATGIESRRIEDSRIAGAAILNAAQLFHTDSSNQTSAGSDQKAALQLAIWSALYRSKDSGVPKASRVSFAAATAINGLASDLLSPPPPSASGHYVRDESDLRFPDPPTTPQAGLHDVAQRRTSRAKAQNFTPVPEPSTMIAGTLLFLPFALSALRSLRKV
jgi:hypothetical protein